jgi:catechol 2,3-dioxygenase-like lactoylglutathione lyase family enzyme
VRAIGASLRFYVEILGLEHLGGFADHDGYDGAFVGMNGADWHLEFTSSASGSPQPTPTDEDLLVLYLSKEELAATAGRLADAGSHALHHDNPYWASVGAVVVRDPDHYLLVLCPEEASIVSQPLGND